MPLKKDMYKIEDEDFTVQKPERKDFTIGQSYEVYAATTIICKNCGGDKFIVGQGDFYTAIKCPACNLEMCIHDG
jgi:hypothetical protein